MMVDTEMRLNGHAADEFYNMMTMVDSDTIRARDNFLSDISCQLDENGVLSIDIDDLDIDLESVDNSIDGIDEVAVSQEETYVGGVSVQFLSPTNIKFNERETLYAVDKYYTSTDMYSINQSLSIKFAA